MSQSIIATLWCIGIVSGILTEHTEEERREIKLRDLRRRERTQGILSAEREQFLNRSHLLDAWGKGVI